MLSLRPLCPLPDDDGCLYWVAGRCCNAKGPWEESGPCLHHVELTEPVNSYHIQRRPLPLALPIVGPVSCGCSTQAGCPG